MLKKIIEEYEPMTSILNCQHLNHWTTLPTCSGYFKNDISS